MQRRDIILLIAGSLLPSLGARPKTARSLGPTLPAALLARADEIIE